MGRNKRNNDLRKITVTAIMAALCFVLMLLGDMLPLSFVPSFLKLDFSELPALITAFAFGPFWGVAVCFIKNLIHLIVFFSNSMGIGELSNFLLGASFVAVAGLIYKHKHNRKFAFIGAITGNVVMAIAAMAVNLLIVFPLYIKFMFNGNSEIILGMYQALVPSIETLAKGVLIFNVPFTFVKGLISVIITFAIYHNLSPILKGTGIKK